jgi:hypothetical protein
MIGPLVALVAPGRPTLFDISPLETGGPARRLTWRLAGHLNSDFSFEVIRAADGLFYVAGGLGGLAVLRPVADREPTATASPPRPRVTPWRVVLPWSAGGPSR